MPDYYTRKGVATIRVEGPFILPRSRRIGKALEEHLKSGRVTDVRVDLSRTTFIDGASLRMLLRLYKRAGEGHFSIRNMTADLFDAFHAVKLDELWHIPEPDEKEESC